MANSYSNKSQPKESFGGMESVKPASNKKPSETMSGSAYDKLQKSIQSSNQAKIKKGAWKQGDEKMRNL
jgi:hypothetical protein